jgi:DNA-binding NarL/FixJ family response regulator
MNHSVEPEVVVLCSDLFFSSSIEGTASQQAVPCRVVASVDQLFELLATGTAQRVVIDLEFPGLDVASVVSLLPETTRPETFAFGPHVKVDQLRSAREAGIDHVLPRSQFSEQLAAILTGHF